MDLAAILPHLLFSLTLLFLVQCSLFPSLSDALTSITTDESALLALKSRLSITPSHVLSKNWSVSTPVCTWIGVTCSSRHHRVASLDLSTMQLTGTLPPDLGNLTFLVSLNISVNGFQGSIPQEFAHLRRLKVIDFAFNNFIGNIPLSFGFLTELKYLKLRNNSFSTFLPNPIANMSKLEKLDLSHNPLHGTIPVEIGNLQSMKILALQFCQLEGVVPKVIFNMSNLEILALMENSLMGNLPADICLGLPRLERLYLSLNELDGDIPANISGCRQLRLLTLAFNKFGGPIPTGIVKLRALEMLLLGDNKLTGIIPRGVGNLTRLRMFHVRFNYLTGTIPEDIGNLENLEEVYLGGNNLTGFIPGRIFNISSLRVISVVMNQLSGNPPSSLGYGLPNLEEIYLNSNNMSGEIPSTISNSSKLSIIDFNNNKFSGTIPNSLGDLAFLTRLFMGNNNFVSGSSELTFITSLANCRFLKDLVLGDNPLNANLPITVGNLSISLENFYCDNCVLYGRIPGGFGNLTNLLLLSLYGNQLTGSIPKTFGNLQNIQGLFFSDNMLSGSIPDVLCGLAKLNSLDLHKNQITGSIPNCIGNLTALRLIIIQNNRLNFSIPQSLWQLNDLLEMNLSSNFLSGSLPPDIGNLKVAILFDLSSNKLTADIPSTIGEMQNLANLALAHNGFQGSIPESVGKLVSLEQLDLSHNNLSGGIPKSLEALRYLTYLDVSYNSLSGEIPSSGPFNNISRQFFDSNQGLCGDPRFGVPPCNNVSSHKSKIRKVILDVVYALLGVVGLIFFLSLAYALVKKYQKKEATASEDNLPSSMPPLRASYHDLARATEGFSNSRLLGIGGFSSVYKGDLQSGEVVAVKVFNLQLERAFRSFNQECEVLRHLRHRNLCKVLGTSSNESFKALLLEYMPNGSLDKWIHFENYFLTIFQRIDMMIDVACALEYLHHGHSKPVVHCDLKPCNVLIDENMVARVSDFGIAKLFGDDESFAQTNTFATIGYIAPEYGSQGIVSTKCDVYSYGIMLMEVFTRTKPNSETFSEGSTNLRSWVNESVPLSVLAIIDATLLKPEEEYLEQKLECLTSIMELGLKCSVESPSERINMEEVVVLLKKIKAKVMGNFPGTRRGNNA